jgi:hypothetical protein
MRWRRPPLQHPLAPAFAHAVESLCTALTPSSKRNYDIVVRSFLVYLGTKYPKITRLEQLRRDPHILGWMAHLRAQNPPLTAATCIGRLFALRTIFHELARTSRLAEQQHLQRMLRGFYQYFGLHHCERKLNWVRQQVQRQWMHALNLRGQRRKTNWVRLKDQPWFKLPFAQNLHPMI